MPLINCEVELILTWSKNCVLADMTVRVAGNNNVAPVIVAPTGLEFKITETKLYVSVVTLSKKKKKWHKVFRKLKLGFKRIIKWNKYRSQMTVEPQNNYPSYLIDPTFTKLIDYLFCRLQEIMQVITEIFVHIIMYQTLKLKTLMF